MNAVFITKIMVLTCLTACVASCDRGSTSRYQKNSASTNTARLSPVTREKPASPSVKDEHGNDAHAQFLKTDNTEEMWRYALRIEAEGTNGIPALLNALTNSLTPENRWSVTEYGRVYVCVTTLHELAKKGISTADEVPVMIFAIRNQTDVIQTFTTAETLRLITGVDPGYSQDFVKGYQEKDEPLRQSKIKQWEEWLTSKRRSNTESFATVGQQEVPK